MPGQRRPRPGGDRTADEAVARLRDVVTAGAAADKECPGRGDRITVICNGGTTAQAIPPTTRLVSPAPDRLWFYGPVELLDARRDGVTPPRGRARPLEKDDRPAPRPGKEEARALCHETPWWAGGRREAYSNGRPPARHAHKFPATKRRKTGWLKRPALLRPEECRPSPRWGRGGGNRPEGRRGPAQTSFRPYFSSIKVIISGGGVT